MVNRDFIGAQKIILKAHKRLIQIILKAAEVHDDNLVHRLQLPTRPAK
jgi:hypothetical protein